MPEDIFENEVEVAADIPQQAEVRQYTSSVTIGDVTTLPAGSQATVTNTGTESNAILNFGLPKGDAGSMWGELAGDIEDQTDLNTLLTGLRTDVDAKAPLASPALTGTPTAPTAVDDTNTTQIATTAFVSNAITNLNNALQTYVQNYVNAKVSNMLGRMNYNAAVSFTARVTGQYQPTFEDFTCPSDGYIYVTVTTGGYYYINGKAIYVTIGGGSGIQSVVWTPVSAGDVIRSNYQSSGAMITGSTSGMFIPQKS